MHRGTTTVTVARARVQRNDLLGRRSIVLALLTVVVVLDQATKWWAWRHVSAVVINNGGNPFVGATAGRWFAHPVAGALLDLLNFGLLSATVSVLVRRRLPVAFLVPGTLMIGGWSSNLLDRLGMHYWTAPGSVRGAVDFIHIDHQYCNIADFFIVGAAPVVLLCIGYLVRGTASRTATSASVAPETQDLPRPRMRMRMSILGGALALIVVVGIGAANPGGVTAPLASARASTHR
jgi:lipoprotein signal peptidase